MCGCGGGIGDIGGMAEGEVFKGEGNEGKGS